MKTQFFLNMTDRDYFMKIMHDKLTAAPIDEKNITTDWIDDLFDTNTTHAYKNGEYMGWIDSVPVRITCTGNTMHVTNLDHEKDPYDAATMIDAVLDNGEEDEILAVIFYDDEFGRIDISFYFETEPEQ